MEDVIEEVVEETEVEEVVEVETEKEEEVKEVPEWAKDPEDTDVPLPTFLKTKRKLKGVIGAKDAELEKIKLELEALKSVAPEVTPTKRPKERDFDTDEEYDAAMDKWDDERFNNISQNLSQVNTQKTQQDRQQQEIGATVHEHYKKAEDLCKQHSIDPDVYRTADSSVRQAVEAILPNQGDQSVDYLISTLGDDSEKVMFNLGRDTKKLAEFQSLLVADPNGLKAAIFLGELKQTIKLNTKQTSRAPKPAVNVSGDKVTPSKGKAEKKKYDSAKTGQDKYNIRKAARTSGIDVKDWS